LPLRFQEEILSRAGHAVANAAADAEAAKPDSKRCERDAPRR
jgi:hypothetical protein